ncbi:MAG: peptide deformylase [Candidatus Marinimicrobia bacterium]|jgi:peptide deformylase|nr:peptide deformylase [Candidatus Neomarinimicrobiota bacterium]MBT3576651.1 peptide deformylase [Candidatus Neomarinimicrobiota bacterium]MBT3678907.1 peptide deformylase [Candidatus Neomarinimicrobiota bacterium]MBT3952260.1 peptide deformylase [Candidatus Neomarinimicrobiota bacterium]MBT4252921.1 peptide deformylase [Candidatus Neomarinimicrobiota bacterium]
MLFEIQTYGKQVLRTKTEEILQIDDNLRKFVADMFETMYAAEGIGLAAPQVDNSIRLFVIDLSPIEEEEGQRVFVNPQIIDFGDEKDEYEEGCLSIPTVREIITRPTTIRITYQDMNGKQYDEEIDGFLARVIQHEYDHLEKTLFIDHLSSLKKSLLKKTLKKIASGEIEVEASENFEL